MKMLHTEENLLQELSKLKTCLAQVKSITLALDTIKSECREHLGIHFERDCEHTSRYCENEIQDKIAILRNLICAMRGE